MKQVGVVYDDIFLLHKTGNHPETPDRLRATLQTLRHLDYFGEGHYSWISPVTPRKATKEEIQWCHSPLLIKLAEERCLEARETTDTLYLDSFNKRYGETVASPKSFIAAQFAAGGMFTAIDGIMDAKFQRGFNLCRPPGHHSDHSNARGFCLFNNIALGVNYLHKKYNINKVAIFDFDAHAGNGTEDLYNQGYLPKSTLMMSMHQHPDTLYPGTCYVDEIGHSAHRGKIVNLTLAPTSGHESVQSCFKSVVLPALHEFRPEFIFVSAGYDAHHHDPLTNLSFMEQTYTWMMKKLSSIADQYARSRILCTLEGGYQLTALSNSIANTIGALGDAVAPFTEDSVVEEATNISEYNSNTMLSQLSHVLSPYWKAFKE